MSAPHQEGTPPGAIVRSFVLPEEVYQIMDPGIRFAVRVLHAKGGIETCQSCQGGPGHSYVQPSIDIIAGGQDSTGFAALAALADYGINVDEILLVWNIQNGLPYEKLWRVTLVKAIPERADEMPMFTYGYWATPGEVPDARAPRPE